MALELTSEQLDLYQVLLAEGKTEEEAATGVISSDPALWAETHLCNPKEPEQPLKLRSIQREVLDAQVRKKVTRLGRRSGKTVSICCDMLWYGMNHSKKDILVVTPYESQIELIFDMMSSLIQYNPDIRGSMMSWRQKPYRIKLNNGTVIRGMTMGSRSGTQAGAAARGRGPDRLYIDEMDFLSHSSMVAILPYLLEKRTRIWCSSTPSGKREEFYKYCTKKDLGYVEFHCTSMEALGDEYSSDVDAEFHEIFDDIEYQHEVMAEFGEEMSSVFRHDDIDACIAYAKRVGNLDPAREIDSIQVNPANIYILGVDWNKVTKVGARFVLIEQIRDPSEPKQIQGKFRIAYMGAVTAKEYTQTRSAEAVVAIYQKVAPHLVEPNFQIYADEGYGHTNVELIQQWADSNGEPRLIRCLNVVDFGSKISIKDPITQENVKKPAKPLIVNSGVKFIEEHQIMLPSMEDYRNGLVGQIREYRVTTHGIGGIPIFTKHNDHDLVSFILCCYGYLDKFTTLSGNMPRSVPRGVTVEKHPFVRMFNPVRDTEIPERQPGRLAPGETSAHPQFREAAHHAGLDYTYAGTNGDYERVMDAVNGADGPNHGPGIRANTGMYQNRSLVPITRPGPRGTTGRGRIRKGYRTRGF